MDLTFMPLLEEAEHPVFTPWHHLLHDLALLHESSLYQAGKAAGKSIYGERLERFRRLIFDLVEKECSKVMDLADRAPNITLTSVPREKQKSCKLVSTHRDGTKLTSPVRCMFRSDKGVLQVRVIADEPKNDAVMVSKKLKNGSPDIWKDWALERNLRKISSQFAASFPAAFPGNWHNTDAYARGGFSAK